MLKNSQNGKKLSGNNFVDKDNSNINNANINDSNINNCNLINCNISSLERIEVNSLNPSQDIDTNTNLTLVSVTDTNFTAGNGTLTSSNVKDGNIKKIILSYINTGSIYTLHIENSNSIVFNNSSENCELVFDGNLNQWLLLYKN